MSPTAPTFVTLNDRLNKAHHRIRELEARETELLAQNRALCAVITELTDEGPVRIAAELCSSPLHISSPNDGGDARFGIGDRLGNDTSRRLGPVAQSPPPAQTPAPASASATRTNRVKTRRSPHV
jgi:hypothetical protein